MRQRAFLLELIAISLLFIVPASVHAGFFANLKSVFSPDESLTTKLEVATHSAAETPLLSATLNPDPAVGGGEVYVEDGALISAGPVGEDDIASSPYRNGEISVYTVQDGDTISQIAEMYGVTSNTIRWANSLKGAIQPGDVLVILPIVGVQHEVEKGETLASIVKEHEGDFDEVLEYNNLTSANEISVGDTIIIPGGEIESPTPVYASVSPAKTSGGSSVGYSHPVPGAVRTQGIHGYNGVDLAAAYGTPIRAAASGEVIVSKSGGWNGGYGNYVVIRHNDGTQTLYAHNSSNAVGVGQWVGTGQTIAYMGSTGRSTGNHLHFEVRGARNPF